MLEERVSIEARSPLADEAHVEVPGLTVAERPIVSLLQLAAWPDTLQALEAALAREALPKLPQRLGSSRAGDTVAMDAGPGRVLLESGRADLFAALSAAVPPDVGTVTDLSHARVRIDVAGPRAAWVLAKGVALDLDGAAFSVGRTVMTPVAHVGVVLRRLDNGFALYPYRGFARALIDWLRIAGAADSPGA